MGSGTFGVSGRLNNIAKHRILGLVKMVSCAKTDRLISTMYTFYYLFLHKELLFAGHNDCTCIIIFSGVNLF